MHLFRSFLASGLVAYASARPEASVYTFPPDPKQPTSSSRHIPSLSIEHARLLLAHRLGLSSYYDLSTASGDVLDLLNRRGSSQILFSEEPRTRRALIFVNVVDGSESDIMPAHTPQFTFTAPNDSTFDDDLAYNFMVQDQDRRKTTLTCDDRDWNDEIVKGLISSDEPLGACSVATNALDIMGAGPSKLLKDVYKKNAPQSYLETTTAIFNVDLTPLLAKDDTDKREAAKTLELVKGTLAEVLKVEGQERTIVVIPRAKASPKRKNRAYGKSEKRSEKQPRASSKEAPMSLTHSSKDTKPSAGSVKTAASNGTTPRTTIAFCWASEKACNENTRSCMGHGACIKKYTEKVSADEDGPECWKCECSSTVIELKAGGTKTTHWGGPACQKKDISVPFWLFVGIAVAATSLVTWSIGMLYSIGQEDLPSVLGAGVAPVTRK